LKLSRAEQIPIFVADPPFLRHEHGNSAILDGNLQMSLKNGGCRQAAKIDKTRLARLTKRRRVARACKSRWFMGIPTAA
jgi:hypothetical protein